MPLPTGCRPSVMMTSQVDPELIADVLEVLAQALRVPHVPDLGRRAHRNVDQQVRRAGGDLLGQDRRDQLALRVDPQRPLDRDQHVVGGREPGGPAPRDAAAVPANDPAQVGHLQLDVGEHFHRVRRARRRRDRAAGGLRNQHAVRGDDRDDQQRRAVAGDAADAVLVRDQRLLPVEALAGRDHGPRQVQDLVAVELVLHRGDDERGDLGLRVVVGGDVGDDAGHRVLVEALAGDLPPDRVQRGRTLGVADVDARAGPSRRDARTPDRTIPARRARRSSRRRRR